MPTTIPAEVPPGVVLLEVVHELQAAETLMANRARTRMGLRASDYQAVQFIAANESTHTAARPKDLRIVLGVTAAAASIIADRLVQKDLIVRTPDPDDRRGRLLTLTDTARTALADVFGSFPEDVQAVLNDIPERDVAVIRSIADQVRTIVDRSVL